MFQLTDVKMWLEQMYDAEILFVYGIGTNFCDWVTETTRIICNITCYTSYIISGQKLQRLYN